jgi:hypothetical protein
MGTRHGDKLADTCRVEARCRVRRPGSEVVADEIRLLAPERFDQGEDVLAGRGNAIGAVGGRAAGPVSALCGRDRPIPFLRKAVEDPCPAGGMVGKPVEAHYERPAAGLKDRNLQSACLNRPMTDAVGRLGPLAGESSPKGGRWVTCVMSSNSKPPSRRRGPASPDQVASTAV